MSVFRRQWRIQQYQRPRRLVWFGPSAGGTAYSIAAGVGSFTLTGNAAGLVASRKLAAGAGAYTLTGYAATLKVARVIGAGVGTFTLTGNAAAFGRTYAIAAGVGSFTLAGNDATLVYTPASGAYTMPAATGTFALTGNPAGLVAARNLAAGVGTFAFTGNAATLVDGGRVLPAGVGSFTLTGNPITVVTTGAVERRDQGAGKPSRQGKQGKRRRIVIGDKAYDVLERDIPALLEAVLTDRKPPRTAEVVETVKPKRRKRRGDDAAPVELPAMPDGPTPDDIAQRVELVQAQLQAQAQADMLRMLDRVAERISLELQDEEDAVLALLLA